MPSMKKLLLSVALLVSGALIAFAQEKKTLEPLADTVLRLEQQWEDALTKSDVSALEKLYDDSIAYTHSNGKVHTKESYLSAIKSGATQYQSMTRVFHQPLRVSVLARRRIERDVQAFNVLARGQINPAVVTVQLQ
jgi:hypothetical protein